MATVNGALACGLKEVSSLEEGNFADIVLIDLNNISLNPVLTRGNLLANIVYGFNGRVSDVIINGKIVLKDYGFVGLDKDMVFDRIRQQSKKV